MTSLGQDVANNRETKKRAAHIVAKSYPHSKLYVTLLFLTSTLLIIRKSYFHWFLFSWRPILTAYVDAIPLHSNAFQEAKLRRNSAM